MAQQEHHVLCEGNGRINTQYSTIRKLGVKLQPILKIFTLLQPTLFSQTALLKHGNGPYYWKFYVQEFLPQKSIVAADNNGG